MGLTSIFIEEMLHLHVPYYSTLEFVQYPHRDDFKQEIFKMAKGVATCYHHRKSTSAL
jgi:hypothetical protein